MADDVELGNPSKKARLDEDLNASNNTDQAKLERNHYSSFALGEVELNNQRNVGEGGHTDDEQPETSKSSAEPAADSDTDSSVSALSNMSGLSGEESWKPTSGPMSWVYRQMSAGMDPRTVIKQIIPHETLIPDLDDLTLWKLIINIMCEPPPRSKLSHINTLADVLNLMRTCKNIVVLTGAGVSVSCGIPDFRSRNGVYARLAVDYPDLPDPQAMFDIHYFRTDQRPFFKFAKEIFPGQFEPSKCHKFIRLIEDHGKLLRNYTQNIDTLEQVAGITRVIQCHGSFASATCMVCGHKCTADDIKADIMNQVIPVCQKCPPDTPQAVMKPDIVFFGESLPEEFHNQMAADKEECDLLIVIGSSLIVRPVALIPNSLPPNIPQILINKEPLRSLNFDVELLGDCDTIVSELCHQLGEGWHSLTKDADPLTEVTEDLLLTPPVTPPVDSVTKGSSSEFNTCNEVNDGTGKEAKIESQVESSGTTDSVSKSNEMESSGTTDSVSKSNEMEHLDTTDSVSKSDDLESSGTGESVSKSDVVVMEVGERENKSDKTSADTIGKSDPGQHIHSTNVAMETELDSVDTSSQSTSGNNELLESDVKTSDTDTQNIKTADAAEKGKGADSKSDNNVHDVGDTGANNDVQSSGSQSNEAEHSLQSESKDEDSNKTGVCYGDKDTCGCSADITELRKMWKPAIVRCSVSKRLGPNQYCFMPPSRYVFPEAEVYTVLEDTDSDSDFEDDLDDGLSDIEDNTDPLNTSDEQFIDKNNSSSEQNTADAAKTDTETSDGNSKRDSTCMNLAKADVEKDNKPMWEKDGDGSDSAGFSSSSKKSGIGSSNRAVATSNELSDSLIDYMDNFTKIGGDAVKPPSFDEMDREAAIQGFHVDFEDT